MPFLFALVAMVASYAISALTAKSQKLTPATMADLPLPQSEEGVPQSVIFGDVWITDWVLLWWGNLTNEPIHAKGK